MLLLPNWALLYYLMSKLIITDCRCLNTRLLWRTDIWFLILRNWRDRVKNGNFLDLITYRNAISTEPPFLMLRWNADWEICWRYTLLLQECNQCTARWKDWKACTSHDGPRRYRRWAITTEVEGYQVNWLQSQARTSRYIAWKAWNWWLGKKRNEAAGEEVWELQSDRVRA